MMNKKGIGRRCLSLALATVMVLSLGGCKGQEDKTLPSDSGSAQAQAQTQAPGEKIVNIGVTSSLNTLNPLLMDGVEMNKYATGLMFLPLTELDKDMNFEGMLADSITAEDDRNFLVHIDDKATWSDGTPVTADDVIYTALRICSPLVGNPAMMYYVFEGVGDDGFVAEGADHVDGFTRVDDKTVRFTTKAPMSLVTFKASYARYLMPLPKHVIEKFSEKDLVSDPWFNHPDVISGPYRVTGFDRDHYISYEANKNYWKGAPKIPLLNIKIVEGSQLYAGLKSGEIDVTQNTMSSIPLEDYASIQSLDNVTASFGDPITNQSVFINTENIPDVRVRQAMLYAINRQQLLEQLLKGNGEIDDGFLSSASPYFDPSLTPVAYDPDKAKALVEESGWDKNKTVKFCIDSGDSTFVNAASVIAAQWAAVGIKADIQTMDINTLLSNAGKKNFDVMEVQYTYPPVDPYADVAWLLDGGSSWTGYSNDKVKEALSKIQRSSDPSQLKGLYSIIDRQMQQDVPMFSAYTIKTMAAVNKRLSGVTPSVYGFLNHVEQWDITQ